MIRKKMKCIVTTVVVCGAVVLLFVVAYLILFTPRTLKYDESYIAITQTGDAITLRYTGEGAVDFNASTDLSTGVMVVSAHYTLWDKHTGTGGSVDTTNEKTTMIQFSDKKGVYTLWEADESDLEKYNSVNHTDGKG